MLDVCYTAITFQLLSERPEQEKVRLSVVYFSVSHE